MNYALITNNIVENIIWINPYNIKDFPTAVQIGERPVGIGDSYIDGKFYRDGVEVLTEAERLAITLADAEAALATLGYPEEV